MQERSLGNLQRQNPRSHAVLKYTPRGQADGAHKASTRTLFPRTKGWGRRSNVEWRQGVLDIQRSEKQSIFKLHKGERLNE